MTRIILHNKNMQTDFENPKIILITCDFEFAIDPEIRQKV